MSSRFQCALRLAAALLVLTLAACTGDDRGQKRSPDPTQLTGWVVNSPLAGAVITVLGPDGTILATTLSGPDGSFSLELTTPPPYRLITTGGEKEGEPYAGELAAWCQDGLCDVTPFSSLVLALVDELDMSMADALALASTMLGVEADPFVHMQRHGTPAVLTDISMEQLQAMLDKGRGLQDWIAGLVAWARAGDTSTPPPGIPVYTVTAMASAGGQVEPALAQLPLLDRHQFSIQPNEGYEVEAVSGCPGQRTASGFEIAAVRADCELVVSFAEITHSVAVAVSGEGLVTPDGALVRQGSVQEFLLQPATGYALHDVSGCEGTLDGDVFTTGAVQQDCTLSVSFLTRNYQVTATAHTGGTISPALAEVSHGAQARFSVVPSAGFSLGVIEGCNGHLDGEIFTTADITGSCNISASFVARTYSVSATAGPGGSLSPVTGSVSHGDTLSFTAYPDEGYTTILISGCAGTWMGNTFVTGPVTEDCSVSASFGANAYSVSATAGEGGTVTPQRNSVQHGRSQNFQVTAADGYEIASVSGCGGTLLDGIFTTAPVVSGCMVSASFSKVVIPASLKGRIAKGIIRDALVEAHAFVAGQWQLIATTFSDENGYFELEITPTGPVRITVTPTVQTRMLCDVPTGCNFGGSSTAFGEALVLDPGFAMQAIYPSYALVAGEMAVTPMTHLAAMLANSLAQVGPFNDAVAAYATARVANLFGLPADFSTTLPVDITDPAELSAAADVYHELLSAAFAVIASDLGVPLEGLMEAYADEFINNVGQLLVGTNFEQETPGLDLIEQATAQLANHLLQDATLADVLQSLDRLIGRWGDNPITSAQGEITMDPNAHASAMVLLDHLDQYLTMAGIDASADFFQEQIGQVNWLYKEEAARQDTLGMLQVIAETLMLSLHASFSELAPAEESLSNCMDLADISNIPSPGYAVFCRDTRVLTLLGTRHDQNVDIRVSLASLVDGVTSGLFSYGVDGTVANGTAIGQLQGLLDVQIDGLDQDLLQDFVDGVVDEQALLDMLLGLKITADIAGGGSLVSSEDAAWGFHGNITARGIVDIAGFVNGGALLTAIIHDGELTSPAGDWIADLEGDGFCQGRQALFVTLGEDAYMQNCFAFEAFGMPSMKMWMDGSLTGLGGFVMQMFGSMDGLISGNGGGLVGFVDGLDPTVLGLNGQARIQVAAHEYDGDFHAERHYDFVADNNRLDTRLEETGDMLSFYATGLHGGYLFAGNTLVGTVTIDWLQSGIQLYFVDGSSRRYLAGPLSDALEPELVSLLLQALQNVFDMF